METEWTAMYSEYLEGNCFVITGKCRVPYCDCYECGKPVKNYTLVTQPDGLEYCYGSCCVKKLMLRKIK